MNLKTNFKTGISLVALVVTIIVLIVMSGAVILSFNKTNILDQAQFAAERQKIAYLQEKITMEKQNEMLSRFGTTNSTGTAQNKTITVQELLNVTEEDALNIVEANSIPENMPAGTYYELDVNRYSTRLRNKRTNLALMSRGVDRENDLVSNTYVVSENFVVYYIIDGKTGAPELPVNDEKVIELLTIFFENWELSTSEVLELKKELHLEKLEGNTLKDISISFYDKDFNYECIYFHTIDRLYKFEWEEIGKDTVYTGKYASREEDNETYEFGKKLIQIVSELKPLFVGKTVSEIQQKYNNGTLDEYILNNCKSINTVKPCWKNWEENEYLLINEISFEFNGEIYDVLCDGNTFYFISDNNGKFMEVYIEVGA